MSLCLSVEKYFSMRAICSYLGVPLVVSLPTPPPPSIRHIDIRHLIMMIKFINILIIGDSAADDYQSD